MYAKLFFICLVRFVLVGAWTQTPEIKQCSEEQYFRVSNISITDATISHIMTASSTLALTKPLGNKPKMKLTLRKKSGIKIPCLFGYGSCTYKLCGGTTEQEQALASMWSNRCPIPTFQETPVLQFPMLPAIQMIAGIAPTKIIIRFKVTNGNETVGCQSFKVEIRRGKGKPIKGLIGKATGLEE
uniref:ML domain containing protein n=1 Tax=Rhipicephalus zambeziensis TaxID=60191 RepID=A0A224YMW2_9ACAR